MAEKSIKFSQFLCLSFHPHTTASITSWSYQSNNPCTVLVNDKIEGSSSTMPRDCPTSVQHSSSETIVSPRDQQEISPSTSLGNSIVGKRTKRQAEEAHDDSAEVVDVVFRGDGHANSSYSHKTQNERRQQSARKLDNDARRRSSSNTVVNDEEEIEVIVEKRILLNISIGMDDGLGSPHLDVYNLQVAVPLPKQTKSAKNFFTYNVVDDSLMEEENLMPVRATPIMTTIEGDDSSKSPSSHNIFDDFIESSTDEGLKNDRPRENLLKLKFIRTKNPRTP